MALYLGNQKVSLRSGQDLTFDYGFDNNGRLVFANKNATEINNFLNYDSTYSEILDLSNLSKMEKVAVNGTADRKMEGLKGLLVSPNAPFTGSSPQINVSYTGLSKSALVSLFESVPYNVGYTKVGNPTIVDGVASGFSWNDYLQTSTTLPAITNNDTIELFTKIIIKNDFVSGATSSLLDSNYIIMLINAYGGVATQLSTSPSTYLSSGISLSAGDSVYCHTKIGNKALIVRASKDNTNWYERTMNLPETFSFNPHKISIGNGLFGTFTYGSIDLNETYIKVNGVPWFTGKPAMTKTCSIVGATGTADLTQEDKNIILNKGWNLTVQ